MYLIDTDVVSELRKGKKANPGVTGFFEAAVSSDAAIFLASLTIGELRRGVEAIRHRGDRKQAELLEQWLGTLANEYQDDILPFDAETAQIWGRLRVPDPQNPLDKQIAATALINDLVVVTGNTRHFADTGVKLLDPFAR